PSDGLAVSLGAGYDVVAIRGATQASRVSEVADALAGRDVVIAGDADEAGRKFTNVVAENLATVAGTVRVAELPDGQDLGDVCNADPANFWDRLSTFVRDAQDSDVADGTFNLDPFKSSVSNVNTAEAVRAFARHLGYDVS